jgi:hypothetical protein
MTDQRQILMLRISLMLAVAAAVAVVAIIHFQLRPQIQKLTTERDQFKALSDQRLARLMKAESHARQLAQELTTTQKQAEAAQVENGKLADANRRLRTEFEAAAAKLHTAKQELARWNATGVTPDRVAFLAGENKALTAKATQLEKENKKILADYAHLKRTLDAPIDDEITPNLPPMKGSVLIVDHKWSFIVLDMGEKDGLRKNGVFMISRAGKLIAKVKVSRVESERSIADILPGWKMSEVKEGDQVIN